MSSFSGKNAKPHRCSLIFPLTPLCVATCFAGGGGKIYKNVPRMPRSHAPYFLRGLRFWIPKKIFRKKAIFFHGKKSHFLHPQKKYRVFSYAWPPRGGKSIKKYATLVPEPTTCSKVAKMAKWPKWLKWPKSAQLDRSDL